jgi:AraC-like DNA-binding protein
MRDVTRPLTAEDERLSRVLLDQIRLAPRFESYLPSSDDPGLSLVLAALRSTPGDPRSLAEWARALNTTERTLARRCRATLGMSFNEWRQRLKLVTALTLLETGMPVKAVAQHLGYGTTSAFIAMFRRLMGMSPARMVKGRKFS